MLSSPTTIVNEFKKTYLPLGEAEIHVTTALSSKSLLLVKAAADGTGGNGQVAVVAVVRKISL